MAGCSSMAARLPPGEGWCPSRPPRVGRRHGEGSASGAIVPCVSGSCTAHGRRGAGGSGERTAAAKGDGGGASVEGGPGRRGPGRTRRPGSCGPCCVGGASTAKPRVGPSGSPPTRGKTSRTPAVWPSLFRGQQLGHDGEEGNATGSDIHVMRALRRSPRQVIVADGEFLGKRQRLTD
jgi:hypothetical protein